MKQINLDQKLDNLEQALMINFVKKPTQMSIPELKLSEQFNKTIVQTHFGYLDVCMSGTLLLLATNKLTTGMINLISNTTIIMTLIVLPSVVRYGLVLGEQRERTQTHKH